MHTHGGTTLCILEETGGNLSSHSLSETSSLSESTRGLTVGNTIKAVAGVEDKPVCSTLCLGYVIRQFIVGKTHMP